MSKVKIAVAAVVLCGAWSGVASAQMEPMPPVAPPPAPVAAPMTPAPMGPAETGGSGSVTGRGPSIELGEKGSFVVDQLSGFRGSVGGGVQYYGPIGFAYNNFTTSLEQNATLDKTRTSITSGDASVKSGSIWIAPSIDYFVAPKISVGAFVGFEARFGSASVDKNTFSLNTDGTIGKATTSAKVDLPTVLSFTIMPRFGYMARVSDRLAIWPRLGLGYFSGSNTTFSESGATASRTISALLVQVDVGIVYQFTDSVFFRLSPSVTFASSGKGSIKYTNATNIPDEKGDGGVFQFEVSTGFGANFSL